MEITYTQRNYREYIGNKGVIVDMNEDKDDLYDQWK